ncbi:MAG: hypothetical protein ACREXP_04240 [Steroidobacteraceae bacterium]
MRASPEISIDLSADELLSPLPPAATKVAHSPAAIADYEDTVEIELTAEQMDALLSGR